jgi:hypothetical protein
MEIPMVTIPVRCPRCGKAGLSEFPVVVVATALVKWNNMCLYAPCHEGGWDAGANELEAIRHHLGRDWIRAHAEAVFEPHPANVTFLERRARGGQRKITAGQVSSLRRGVVISMHGKLRQVRDVN